MREGGKENVGRKGRSKKGVCSTKREGTLVHVSESLTEHL